jgi:hypothetical protein
MPFWIFLGLCCLIIGAITWWSATRIEEATEKVTQAETKLSDLEQAMLISMQNFPD